MEKNSIHMKHLKSSFQALYHIVVKLRGPDGCAWDRKQTPYSLRPNLVEETFECINAIENRDDTNLKEELGDIFLILMMIVRMKEEEKSFTLKDVFEAVSEKLVRRHPHVFADVQADSIPEILTLWKTIKETTEGKAGANSTLEQESKSLLPLEQALFIQKKAEAVGFDWKSVESVWQKLDEEITELKHAVDTSLTDDITDEMGDLLFTVVNLCRKIKINPSIALHGTNQKFVKRFSKMTEQLKRKNLNPKMLNLRQLDEIWDEIKHEEKNQKTGYSDK